MSVKPVNVVTTEHDRPGVPFARPGLWIPAGQDDPLQSALARKEEQLRVDRHWLSLALKHSEASKDPETRVGSFIVGPDGNPRAAGYNRFPEGILETPERMNDREFKLRVMVHAELSAITAAARAGSHLDGCTLYLAATDDSGLVWGGPPCTRCTSHIIPAGIKAIVALPTKPVPSKWHEDLRFAHQLLAEAGISFREVAL